MITRLPREVRDRLNERIRDGMPVLSLVTWLNGLEVVREMMRGLFIGQPITAQHLAGWKQGGYLDWLAHEERRDWLERLTEQSEDLLEDAGYLPVMERVGTQMEVLLGRAVDQVAGGKLDVKNPEELKRLLALSKEVGRHRRLAMAAARVREGKLQEEEGAVSGGLQ